MLTDKINNLSNSSIKETVDKRLSEFKAFENKEGEEWFSELCFCLLTANSRASSAIRIQNQMGANGFIHSPRENIVQVIKMNKHRFHNNKAKFIVNARKFANIKATQERILKEEQKALQNQLLLSCLSFIALIQIDPLILCENPRVYSLP